jgi:hypothetical protein
MVTLKRERPLEGIIFGYGGNALVKILRLKMLIYMAAPGIVQQPHWGGN